MSNTADEAQIKNAYTLMYDGMIAKDAALLDEVLDESFVLLHMTGMKQSKQAFIQAVMNGTLNYFSARHDSFTLERDGDTAVLIGQSYVAAAVFGGRKSNWRLQQRCTLRKTNDGWKITGSSASTY